jgi:hypothetical protein
VPVKQQGHFQKTIESLEIDNKQDWRSKHLRSIEMNYRKAKNFTNCFPALEALFKSSDALLADLCFRELSFWLREFNIDTPVVRASTLSIEGKKSNLVLALCQHFGADTYLSGPQGRGYLDIESFNLCKIQVQFHDFVHPKYEQLYGDFLPAMSVIDYWMTRHNSLFITKKDCL